MSAADALDDLVTEALARATDQLLQAAGPRAYTPAEVAARLGVSVRTVYRLVDDGRLPVVPHLPKKRIPAEALARFMRGEYDK